MSLKLQPVFIFYLLTTVILLSTQCESKVEGAEKVKAQDTTVKTKAEDPTVKTKTEDPAVKTKAEDPAVETKAEDITVKAKAQDTTVKTETQDTTVKTETQDKKIETKAQDITVKTKPTVKNPPSPSPLKSTDVSEGACLVDPPTAFLNPVFWMYPRTFYVTIGSEYAFRRYAETYLGRSAKSVEELESMCLRLELTGFSYKTFGYGEYLGQTCAIPWRRIFTRFDWGSIKCYADDVSSDRVQKSFVDDYTDNLVLTDNETFGMYARCVNGIKDFKVLTITREVSQDVYEKVKEKAISLGFDGSKVRLLKCNEKSSESKTSQSQTDSRTEL